MLPVQPTRGVLMPVGERERHALLFNLQVISIPEEADVPTIGEVVQMLQQVYRDGKAKMLVGERVGDEDEPPAAGEAEGGENLILIRAIEVDPDGYATLLIQHGDARAADPALMGFSTGDIRRAGKKRDEGVAHAAHLVISTEKDLSLKGNCRAVLERIPNLGRSTVINFLNRLLRKYAQDIKMEYEDKESGRPRRYHPKLASFQQMSHLLKTDLTTGKLQQIELVKFKPTEGFEEPNVVVPLRQTIVHKVVKSPTGAAAFDLVERFKSFGKKNNFDEVQIKFRKTDTSQNLSPRFATDLDDAQDAVYARFEFLSPFPTALEQCPQGIVTAVRDRLLHLFKKPERWK